MEKQSFLCLNFLRTTNYGWLSNQKNNSKSNIKLMRSILLVILRNTLKTSNRQCFSILEKIQIQDYWSLSHKRHISLDWMSIEQLCGLWFLTCVLLRLQMRFTCWDMFVKWPQKQKKLQQGQRNLVSLNHNYILFSTFSTQSNQDQSS